MMKYQVINQKEYSDIQLRDTVSNNTLTAPELGVYTVLFLNKNSEVDFKEHLLDSMEQISAWLRNLKEHGFIDVNDHEKTITILH